jgi:hypothetical protein
LRAGVAAEPGIRAAAYALDVLHGLDALLGKDV